MLQPERSPPFPRSPLLPLLLGALGSMLCAQQGDRGGEVQTDLPDDLVVPPAIVRSPAEEMATFVVADGFRVELVASEPLIGDPVAAVFDAAARLWVVEMRGFMNDVDARNERAPNGRIVVLEDDDGDGRMDRSTVFLDGLVLPRAVLPLRGGALVLEPPNLWWCPDVDGDLRADGAEFVIAGFEAGLDNPEHSGNGLLWARDNRIHIANDKRLLRWTPDGFAVEQGAGGGQWGITQDDRGRCYFNYNEDWLRVDLVPGRHAVRANALGALPGTNHRLLADTSVWPVRITPGVNRGYQPGRLRDHVLAIHTAVCGPHVYRGELLPGCHGDAFVCEPAGNCVRRVVLEDHDGRMRGRNPYQQQRREFLASTDERFRPVNLTGGPDGALYLVDLYRGVIQHKNFVTTFLRKQILARGLEAPIGLGRIWRIVPDGSPRPRAVRLDRSSVAEVVAALGGGDGHLRDLAQRELVQRQDPAAVVPLQRLLSGHGSAAVRIAALATLDGLGRIAASDVRRALHDGDPGVVAFGLSVAASELARGDRILWMRCEQRGVHWPTNVRWHLALALGDVLAQAPPQKVRDRAMQLLAALANAATSGGNDAVLEGAIVRAVHGREHELLGPLLAAGSPEAEPFTRSLLAALGRSAMLTRDPVAQQALFAAAAAAPATWQQAELLQGAVAALPKGKARAGFLVFPAVPDGLRASATHGSPAISQPANELLAAVALRGPRAAATSPPARAPTEAEREVLAQGEQRYAVSCAACHQLDGRGLPGLAPPLRDSEWVLGSPTRLAHLVLGGVKGPIEVDGATFTGEMPGQAHLSDQDVAAVLSYLRRAFGHDAAALEPGLVAAVRQRLGSRREPFTAAELLAID